MEKNLCQTIPNVLKKFASLLGTEVDDWRLEIPENFGSGYCSGFVFNKHIRMLIFNYELNENMVVENPDVNDNAKTILFKFQNIFPKAGTSLMEEPIRTTPSVLIATMNLSNEVVIPVHTNTATINIEVDTNYLEELFVTPENSPVLHGLLNNTLPLIFEQMINPRLQKIVDAIVFEPVEQTFRLFYLRIKAEELICGLLIELVKWEAKKLYSLNSHDVKIIYQVKEQMLKYLETPPVIGDLAVFAGMSPTKLKRLFNQIFGNSIFNYYQEFKMNKAAFLLKEGKLSVSQVGYQLGYTNLSHFSKVFKKHTGFKPKQYSIS